MPEKAREQQHSPKEGPQRDDKHVVSLEEAGENFGVEDTPYNAPEEVEAQERRRKDSEHLREQL
jgi:hypothetical protein